MLNDGIIHREQDSQQIFNLHTICSSPKAVKIEISSKCNFKCNICYNKFGERHNFITDEYFDIALQNVLDMDIKQVGLLYLGESTLHPNLVKYIKKCKEKGIEYVFITTNGYLIKDKLMEDLLTSGLDSLKWSINQCNKEQFLKETNVDGFDIVKSNIQNAWLYKKNNNLPIRLYASTVVKDINNIDDDMKCFIDNDIKPFVDEHTYNELTNHGGLEDNKACSHIKSGLIPCPRLFNNTYICSNLDVMCCCNGFTKDFKIGNLCNNTLKDIWNCKYMQELRLKHINNDLKGTICEK